VSQVPPTAQRPVEAELKLAVLDAAAAARLIGQDELAGFRALAPAKTRAFDDRYVDTADGALARAGFAARLRRTPEGSIVSLKSLRTGGEGSLHRRDELEAPADIEALPRDWPPSPARAVVLERAGDAPLLEVVRIRQSRNRRRYGRDGAVVELSLDAVEVVARETVVDRFDVLEIEVVEGDDDVLEGLASVVSDQAAFTPDESSKLERALAVLRDRDLLPPGAAVVLGAIDAEAAAPSVESGVTFTNGSTPDRAAPDDGLGSRKTPGVEDDDPLAEAARKVLRFHLARMLDRQDGARSGESLEDIHKMRVATRRQRAAWRVFGDAFDPKRTRRHRRRLRALAGRLGAVRDLDVLIEAAEEHAGRHGTDEAAAIAPLLDGWRTDRDQARVLLVEELASPGYEEWIAEYREFVGTEGAGIAAAGPTTPHRVRDRMPSRIWAAYEGVRAYEPVLRWADVETLHELRIAAKWLRYTIEFVAEPLGPDAGPLVERIVGLQDHLGWLHDADVSAGLARGFLMERSGDLSEPQNEAIGRYLVDREREVAHLRRTVGPTWRSITGLAFRRSLGRAVASL